MFVTHGDEGSALAFETLLKERGHGTFVPFSGDAWLLAQDRQTQTGPRALAEKKKGKLQKAVKAENSLAQALARLTRLVQGSQGMGNKLKDKLARQIDDLARKWED